MKILFVCMGNICRSPLAAVAADRAFRDAGLGLPIEIDSAGTLDDHAGRPADTRAIALAAEAGLDLAPHRARQVRRHDFDAFDLIVAMDRRNLADLQSLAPATPRAAIRLLMAFAGQDQGDVPDPYYGDRIAFERSFALIREGVAGLTKHLGHLHNRAQSFLE